MFQTKFKTITEQPRLASEKDRKLSLQKIGVLGIPYNTGSKGRKLEEGAAAIRKAGIIEALESFSYVMDFNNLKVTLPAPDDTNPKLLRPNQVETLCKALAPKIKTIVNPGYLPFIVAGDCSMLMGIIEGLHTLGGRIGLVYLDAHGDFNTPETTPSGIVGGMDVAIAVGKGPERLAGMFGHSPLLSEENVVLFGTRDLDPLEAKALAESKVKVLTRDTIRLLGADKAAAEVLAHLEPKCDCLYLHVDLDVLDESVFSAAGLPVPDGLSRNEFLSISAALAESEKLCCVTMAAFDAAKDLDGSQARKLVQLAAEAFGKGSGKI